VKTDHGIVAVVLAGQEAGQLDVAEFLLQRVELGDQVSGKFAIVLGGQKLVQKLDVVELLDQLGMTLDVVVQVGELGSELLTLSGVVPYAGLGQPPLQLGGLPPLGVDVKGTPSRWPPCGRRPRSDQRTGSRSPLHP
jgi:hypothetical protein